MSLVGNLTAKLGLDTTAFQAGIGTAESQVGGFAGKLGGIMAGIATAVAGAFAVDKIVQFAGSAVEMAGKMEQTRLAFDTMLGSAEASTQFLDKLKQFAASTPFEFPDLVRAAQKMKALGFETEQVIPTLTTIGNAVAGLGGGSEMIDRVTLALGQMQTKGKVSAQEMNQLAESGIGAWKSLAAAIGVSIPEAMKLAEQGAISASTAIPAILDGMNTQFAGLMDRQSGTLLGQWSNFKDQLTFLTTDIGNALIPALQSLLSAVTPVFEAFKTWVEGAAPQAKELFSGIAESIGAFITWLTTGNPLIQAFAGAFSSVAAVIGPLGSAAAAAIAPFLTLGLELAGGVLIAGLNTIKQTFDGLKQVLDFVKPAIDLVVTAFQNWASGLGTLLEWVSKIPGVKAVFGDLGGSVEDAKKKFDGLQTAQKNSKTSTDNLKQPVKGLHGEIATLATKAKAAKDEHESLTSAQVDFALKLADSKTKVQQAREQVEKWNTAWADGTAQEELDGVTSKIFGLVTAANGIPTVVVPAIAAMAQPTDASTTAMQNLTAAYKTFGIQAPADLQATATKYGEMRDAILADPTAGEQAKNTAVYKALEAQAAYMTSIGQTLPADQAKLMDNLKTAIDGKKEAVKGSFESPFKEAFASIQSSVTQHVGNITDILTGERDGSILGELKSLGQSVLTAFVNPFEQALNGLVNGAIKSLMGWLTGPDGILGGLGKITGSLGGIFGGAGGATGSVAGAAGSAAGGVGSAAGGAASGISGAASGLMGTLGSIGSIAGGIGSIAGLFYSPLSGDTGKIEVNTRECKAELQNLRADAWDRETHLFGKLDDWRTVSQEALGNIYSRLGEMWVSVNQFRDGLTLQAVPLITEIKDATAESAMDMRAGSERIVSELRNISGILRDGINVRNLGDLASQLRVQGAVSA